MHSFNTEKLLIRPLAEQDKALFISLYTDAKVMRNIGEALSHQKAEKAFSNTLKVIKKDQPKIMTWTIVNLADNKAIGIQGFTWSTPTALNDISIDNERQTAEIGIMLLRGSNGKLLPEEAIGALIEYGFSHLKLKQINACFTKKNLATARVAKKVGFTFNAVQQSDDVQQKLESVFSNTWQSCYIKKLI